MEKFEKKCCDIDFNENEDDYEEGDVDEDYDSGEEAENSPNSQGVLENTLFAYGSCELRKTFAEIRNINMDQRKNGSNLKAYTCF